MEDDINDKVILRQLHEQYAINNNNSLSAIKIAESQQIKIKKEMQMNCKRICNCWIVGSVLICIFIFLAILSHFY